MSVLIDTTIWSLADAFDDVPILKVDYVQAARFFNACRAVGIAGTHVDLLICAIAHREEMPIFTSDADFERYARVIPVNLHPPVPG